MIGGMDQDSLLLIINLVATYKPKREDYRETKGNCYA